MRPIILPILAALAATPALAQPVTVVVEVPTPAGVPAARLAAGMRAAVPEYRAVPGLISKSFTIGAQSFGGVYLFTDRAAADAWFNPAWHQRVRQSYGQPARVTVFDVPVMVQNAPLPAGLLAER